MSGDKAAVEKLLNKTERGPSETCRFVFRVTFWKEGDNAWVERSFALVANVANPKEMAVFALKVRRFPGKSEIVSIFPVTMGLRLDVKEDYRFDLYYENTKEHAKTQKFRFTAQSKDSRKQILAQLAAAVNIAAANRFVVMGKSHKWLRAYKARDHSVEWLASQLNTVVTDDMHESSAEADLSAVYFADTLKSLMKSKMAEREDSYSAFRDYLVLCGTWNVASAPPEEFGQPGVMVDLSNWLAINQDTHPSIVCIGLQEADMSAQAFVQESNNGREWRRAIESTLFKDKKANYQLVKMQSLVGMFLFIYAKAEMVPQIKNVESDYLGTGISTGIAGKLGNKGGVSIRFQFQDTTFCLVNSHFAARLSKEMLERRNQDQKELQARLLFNAEDNLPPFERKKLSVLDHDVLIWMGDMNYRINQHRTKVEVMINKKDWPELLRYDELTAQRNARNVFRGFHEHAIDFAPTYKYDPGTDHWDTVKMRTPAYTDRMVYIKNKYVEQQTYTRHELRLSDHRPVRGIFNVRVRTIDWTKYESEFSKVQKELDEKKDKFKPTVKVTTNFFDFGPVKYRDLKSKTVTIENAGKVHVVFAIEHHGTSKPWLTITPNMGFIPVGSRVSVTLSVFADDSSAPALNNGREELKAKLSLRIFDAGDAAPQQLVVTGMWERSCFGMNLKDLRMMPDPVRFEQKTHLSEPLAVPKELWRLVDILYYSGKGALLDTEGLFLEPGIEEEMRLIREALDTGGPFPKHMSAHSVAETLIMFLNALPEPVVESGLYMACLEASANYAACKAVIGGLDQVHFNVFRYITSFLREVLVHTASNHLDPDKLAVVFSQVLLRPIPGPVMIRNAKGKSVAASEEEVARKRSMVIFHFLNDQDE